VVGILGQSRHAVVFEMQPTATTLGSSSSAVPPPCNIAVKVFPQQSEAYYDAEFANLKRLGEIFGPNPHVPHLDKDVGTVTEVVRGIMHVAIISLPVCAPVLPQPGGQRLRAAHYVQLLEVLQHAHQHRMYHCDVKPDNILMHGDHVVQGASALVRLHRYRLRTEHEYGGMLIPHTSETARFAGPYQLVGLCSHGYLLLGLSNPHCVLLQ
jgi:hypothetical protein